MPEPPRTTIHVDPPDSCTLVMRYGSDDVLASAVSGFCEYLIPDYANTPIGDTEDRLMLRAAWSAHLQVELQQAVCDSADTIGCSPAEKTLLSRGVDSPPPTPSSWSAPVPLVLVVTDYLPWSEDPPPEPVHDGVVWWIDPSADETLIESLMDCGVLTVEPVRVTLPS